MSSKEERLDMYNELVRIGPYKVPQKSVALNRNIVTNEASIKDTGTRLFTGNSVARSKEDVTTNYPKQKIDGYDKMDIWVDFGVVWHLADEQMTFNEKGESSVIKSANRNEHRVRLFELFLNAEKNIEESMGMLLMNIARKYLTGLPFTIVQNIDNLDNTVFEESKNNLVNDYKELYNDLIKATKDDGSGEERELLQKELDDKIKDLEQYHENLKDRLLTGDKSVYDKICKEFKEECYNKYGIVVKSLSLTEVKMPEDVNRLYNEKKKQIQEAAIAKIKARANAETSIIDAEGKAQVKEIEANAEAMRISTVGTAQNEVYAGQQDIFEGNDWKETMSIKSPENMPKVEEKNINFGTKNASASLGEQADELFGVIAKTLGNDPERLASLKKIAKNNPEALAAILATAMDKMDNYNSEPIAPENYEFDGDSSIDEVPENPEKSGSTI